MAVASSSSAAIASRLPGIRFADGRVTTGAG
jgi:hypothetical protein